MDLQKPTLPLNPVTPETSSRGRSLYPTHLSRLEVNGQEQGKRVPLHRRGKSRTYERLEDLLREAGYSETRIFTPEAERLEAQAKKKANDRERGRGGGLQSDGTSEKAGGFIAFLSGLIRGGAWRLDDEDSKERFVEGSKPTETLSWGRAQGRGVTDSLRHEHLQNADPPSPSPKSKVDRKLQSSAPNQFAPIIVTSPPLNSPSSESSKSKSTSLCSANQFSSSSSSSLSPPLPYDPSRHGLHQSRATAALRHMISAPNIQHRPRSSYAQPPSAERRSSEAITQSSYRHFTADSYSEPPLPTNWLRSVAEAVLGTGPGSGAYVGGPRGRPQNKSASNSQDVSSSATICKGLPSRSQTPKPALGVTLASVTCHSAPGSRSSSVARRAGKHSRKNSLAHRKRRDSLTRVPSLGVTTVELDLCVGSADLLTPSADTAHIVHLDSGSDASDDDADPEPDFSSLLMPARRQNSIRSLRKHLHHSQHTGGGRALARPSSVASFRSNTNGASGSSLQRGGSFRRSREGTDSAVSSMRRLVHSQSAIGTGMDSRPPTRQSVIAPQKGEFDPDDSFEASLAQDLLRSRRGSIDEGDGLADWPGLLRTSLSQGKKRERHPLPATWRPWAQN